MLLPRQIFLHFLLHKEKEPHAQIPLKVGGQNRRAGWSDWHARRCVPHHRGYIRRGIDASPLAQCCIKWQQTAPPTRRPRGQCEFVSKAQLLQWLHAQEVDGMEKTNTQTCGNDSCFNLNLFLQGDSWKSLHTRAVLLPPPGADILRRGAWGQRDSRRTVSLHAHSSHSQSASHWGRTRSQWNSWCQDRTLANARSRRVARSHGACTLGMSSWADATTREIENLSLFSRDSFSHPDTSRT